MHIRCMNVCNGVDDSAKSYVCLLDDYTMQDIVG